MQITMNWNKSHIKFEPLLAIVVGMVVWAALEIPDWLILVTGLPIPWLGHWFPYAAPFLLILLLFLYKVNLTINRGVVSISLSSLFFSFFVVVLLSFSVIHWLISKESYGDWLAISYFWIFTFYLVFRFYSSICPGARRIIVNWAVFFILTTAFLQFVLTEVLSDGRGTELWGLQVNQLFDSATLAYISVLGVALLSFEYRHKALFEKLIFLGVLVPFLFLVIYGQRMLGPMLLAGAIVALKLVSLIPIQFHAVLLKVLFAFVALLLLAIYAFSSIQSNDPTVAGLSGGVYYFDEVGHLHGDIMSSFTRVEAMRLQLQQFFSNPIFGVGMHDASKIKVLYLGMHSSFIYILVTSGLIGFGLIVIYWIYTLRAAFDVVGLSSFVYFGIWLGHGLLATEPVWWWSLLFFLSAGFPADLKICSSRLAAESKFIRK